MKRKITALLCLLLCVTMLGGCSVSLPWKSESVSTVMEVSGAKIGSDLFAYYLTIVLREPEKYNLADTKDKKAIDKAAELCVQYVAINSAFENEKLSLSPDYKNEIAENVSTKWSFYKNYYSEVGIRKQTITKYETNEAKRKMLLEHKYGIGGTQPVSEIELNAYYAVNYVTFQSINGYLTKIGNDGKTQRLSEAEITAAENRFKKMCDDVRTGASLEDVCKENANDPYVASSEVETITINRNTNNYPKEFFSSVQQMDVGAPRVIETNDYIFLVVKQSDKSDADYQAHKLACLQLMCAEPFSADIKAITDGYTVQKYEAEMKSVAAIVQKKF